MKRRIGLVVVLALALSLAFLTVASAHAKLVSSDPAAGAKLTSAPAKVTLVFSEEISDKESESFFKVTNASGASVGTGKLDTNDLDHKTLSGTLQTGLGDGVYTVAWETITPDDNGHSVGSFTFGINADPGVQPTAAPEPTEMPEATATPAAAGGAAQPTAAPAAKPTPKAAGGTPGNLPRTGESGPNLTPYLLAGAAVLLVGGLALRRRKRDARH
ncbi:MAG: copper resistance protein CopC [Roseiflexaceae bacterium]